MNPVDLYSRTQGTGPDVIVIHGLFGASDNLGGLARGLGADYRVHSIDLRNHGRSPHSPDHSYPLMADDVFALMDRLDIPSAAIFGHSMGGKVAMQMALTNAARVTRLVVGDIAPVTYGHHHQSVLAAMTAAAESGGDRQAVREVMAPYLDDERVTDFLLTNWRRGTDGRWGWRVNLDAIKNRYANIAAAPSGQPYAGKTLFIRGVLSNYVTADMRPEIEALFPNAVAKGLAQAGHWFHAEKPDMTLRVVHRFLGE